MRQPVELKGRAASSGIFIGPIIRIGAPASGRKPTGAPAAERAALESAIASAIADVTTLMDKVEGEGGEVLAFQVAMLEDAALRAPALEEIDRGTPADTAWAQALAAEIAGYVASDDDYFRARAADLRDIRDRVLRHLIGVEQSSLHQPAVLAGEDVAPTLFLETDWSNGGAIALTAGSSSSHVAMLARARGVPMVVGLGTDAFDNHEDAIVDGEAGLVVLSPDPQAHRVYGAKSAEIARRRLAEKDYLDRPAVTADGTRIEVLVNIAGTDELAAIDPATCDGIGLMRTEFLFRDGAPLPDEEAQYRAYRRFLEWAGDKPVTIRTLDIGGDKPIRGLTPEGESNPFLGLRGVRLTLARPDIFRIQLRALARAALHGRLKVMIPMVTVPSELAACRKLFGEVSAGLECEKVACARPPLGMMVEVPAAAVAPELFADAAFFSIGSNDLTQYVTASARDDPGVAALNDPSHPAVLRLIGNVAAYGNEHGIPVSLCGDMASEPRHLEQLLRAGLRSISIAPAALGRVKAAIASITLGKPT
jgi:phosphotransferase system enzyme I (PtsI)